MALFATTRHQVEPSMGPALMPGLSEVGIKLSIALSRAEESAVNSVSLANVGESCVAC
jgi:hypothetical protein